MIHKITTYPWKVQFIDHSLYIQSTKPGLPMVGREGTMRAQGRAPEEHRNNANLMAASPELLECLNDLLGCTELNLDDMEKDTRQKIDKAFAVMSRHDLIKLLWEPD